MQIQRSLGQSPINWGIFENFCVKGNLTACRVTLQKKIGGAEYTSCYLNNFIGGATAAPAAPVPAPMEEGAGQCNALQNS